MQSAECLELWFGAVGADQGCSPSLEPLADACEYWCIDAPEPGCRSARSSGVGDMHCRADQAFVFGFAVEIRGALRSDQLMKMVWIHAASLCIPGPVVYSPRKRLSA